MNSSIFYRNVLYVVVFITGGCVLILEILATRVLSPYYGTTIFTVSSVIGVVLAALSAGYYLGGRLADHYSSKGMFFGIILLSGLSVLLLQWIYLVFLPVAAYSFSMLSGPPVFSVALFFLPALLLGMVSPYVVALQYKRLADKGVGQIAGNVFFWGTLGSISGTFLAGFYLIPSFGIRNIITGVALALIGLGLLGAQSLLKKKAGLAGIVIVILLTAVTIALSRSWKFSEKVIFIRDGVYEQVAVVDMPYKGLPARILVQDANMSSGIYMPGGKSALDYSFYYQLYRLTKPRLKRALVIGGGALVVPQMILDSAPNAEVEVVDIEPILYDVAHKYFNIDESPRLHEIVDDGRRFVYDTENKYDLIFIDAFHGWNVPIHLTTREFLTKASSRLSDNGVLVANLIGNVRDSRKHSYLEAQLSTWQKVFPNSAFFAVRDPRDTYVQNVIAAGFNTDDVIDFSTIKDENDPFLAGLENHIIKNERFVREDIILTDDYAPVDWLLARDLISQDK